ncbi:MAG TPA: DUF4272 domain-containing protein [Longimicrobium sp.]
MTNEPLSIFGRNLDRAAVARRMREVARTVELDRADEDGWRSLTASFGRLWSRKTLTLTYDPAHCSEPEWPRQMDGMRGYYSRFPDTPRKARVMMLTHTFRFVFGTRFAPEHGGTSDPRVQALFAVAELLDAVLFTPSALLDARGRVLFGARGQADEDPDAAWPKVAYAVSVDAAAAAAEHGDDDEDAEASAPTPERVAVRALALAALSARGMMEAESGQPEIAGTYQRLLAWARETGAEGEMEEAEREVLRTPLGSLDPQAQVNACWRLDGLGVLLWALGRCELPPHDQTVDANTLWRAAGLLDAGAARELSAAPVLRPRDEIATLRKRLFALHWRLREYNIRRRAMDFAQFASTAWFGPLDITGFPLADGDLAIGGARIDRAPQEQLGTAFSIAHERHLAANWLWEGPELYSEADDST